jgi:hypothetical protein
MPALRQRHDALVLKFFLQVQDGNGGGAIHANLEALDAGIEPTWCCAWLEVEAGFVALVRPFQGDAALAVVVAQFVVTGAMFLFLYSRRCRAQVAPGAGALKP